MRPSGINVGHDIIFVPVHNSIVGVFFETVPESDLLKAIAWSIRVVNFRRRRCRRGDREWFGESGGVVVVEF